MNLLHGISGAIALCLLLYLIAALLQPERFE